MALWHQTIEDDKRFNEQLAYNLMYVRTSQSQPHPALIALMRSVRYSRPATDYRIPNAHDVYGFNDVYDSESDNIFTEIGRVIVNELAEHNPKYMERIMLHALKLVCDQEFVKLENRRASVYAKPQQQPRKLVNDDYDYWWEFGDDESSVVIMCDYDGMPEGGLDSIEFEFDDEEEKRTAIEEGERIVRGLNADEIPLSKFFESGDSDPRYRFDWGGDYNPDAGFDTIMPENDFVAGYTQNFKMEIPK